MARLTCTVVTPEAAVLVREADFLALPLYDGEIGIAPRHAPLIGRLGFGEMRLRDGDTLLRYYLDGGFVQVNRDNVSVLTNRAIPADRIDEAAARDQLYQALQRPAHNAELLELRDRLTEQARGQLRVSRRAEETK